MGDQKSQQKPPKSRLYSLPNGWDMEKKLQDEDGREIRQMVRGTQFGNQPLKDQEGCRNQ